MSAYAATATTASAISGARPRLIGSGVRRLALVFVWITIASSAIVVSDPAPYDALMVAVALLLPVVGLAQFNRGISLYLLLWVAILSGGLLATTQAVALDVPASHMGITVYLALSSVVLAAFVAHNPECHVRLIMSAYMASALIAASGEDTGGRYRRILPGRAAAADREPDRVVDDAPAAAAGPTRPG